jgi:hypothetical protein
MSNDITNIKLQSVDGVLVAKNTAGTLTYPELFVSARPTDAQMLNYGSDCVVVYITGKEVTPPPPPAPELNRSILPSEIFKNVNDAAATGVTIIVFNANWNIPMPIDYLTVTPNSGNMVQSSVSVSKNKPNNTGGAVVSVPVIFTDKETGETLATDTIRVVLYNFMTDAITLNAANSQTLTYTRNPAITGDYAWTIQGLDPRLTAVPTAGTGNPALTISAAAGTDVTQSFNSAFSIVYPESYTRIDVTVTFTGKAPEWTIVVE